MKCPRFRSKGNSFLDFFLPPNNFLLLNYKSLFSLSEDQYRRVTGETLKSVVASHSKKLHRGSLWIQAA
jgi:hypothetical protein